MSTRGARSQTKARGSEGRLVRGDGSAGGKERTVCILRRGVREETRTGLGRSEIHAQRREESAFHSKCDEEEWVDLPDEFKKFGKYAKLKS